MKLQQLAESSFDAVSSFIEHHCKNNAGCSKDALAKAVAHKFGKPYRGVVNDMYYQLVTKPAEDAKRSK